jgi:hypothetical protein
LKEPKVRDERIPADSAREKNDVIPWVPLWIERVREEVFERGKKR